MQVPKAPWTSQDKVHIKHGISVPAAIWSTSAEKRGCRQPLPYKGCHRVMREGLWCCHAEERAGSWQLAWPRGIRESPTFLAHTVAHAAAGPTRPLFFFCLPCSQLSAYYRSRRFGQRSLCTHNAGAHEMLGDSVSPLSPWQNHHFPELPLHLPSQNESLDPPGGTGVFLGIRNHPSILTFLNLQVFFFQPPPPSCVFLWLKHWPCSLGSISTFPRTSLGGMLCVTVSQMVT